MLPKIYLAEQFARLARNRITTAALHKVLEAGESQHYDVTVEGRTVRVNLYEVGAGAPTPITTLPTSSASPQPTTVQAASTASRKKLGLLPLFLLAAIALLLFGGIASCIAVPRHSNPVGARPATTATPNSRPFGLCDMSEAQLSRAFKAPVKKLVITNVYLLGQCVIAIQGDFVVPEIAQANHGYLLGFIHRGNGRYNHRYDRFEEYMEATLLKGQYANVAHFPGKAFKGVRWTIALVNPGLIDDSVTLCSNIIGLYKEYFLQPGDKSPSACYTPEEAHKP